MSWDQDRKKLEAVLKEKFERGLDSAEEDELIELLKSSEEAREYYFDYCELHTMLEMEPELHRELTNDRLPENVVALSDEQLAGSLRLKTGGSRERVISSEEELPVKSASSQKVWAVAAALAATLTLLFLVTPKDREAGQLVSQGSDRPGDTGVPGGHAVIAGNPTQGDEVQSENNKGNADKNETVAGLLVKDGQEERELTPVREKVESANQQSSDDRDPMEKYEEMLLTAVQPGSLKRPPTPFSNEGGSSKKISFNRDIRPLLSDNCYQCHGPDENSREAELRLDMEEAVFTKRGSDQPVLITRGDPAKSDLYRRLIASDPDDLMPPAKSHKALTAQEIAKLKKWIEQGAEWESHWAFIVPKQEGAPKSKSDGGVNEIDHYVVERLKEEGLKLSPEADRRTLIRRVTLDITGLPPSPEEVELFVNDSGKDAYGRLVDRLLDSPRYGEHRARYWLDAARYGDTHGLHLDNYRSIWPYRDWVIRAYNNNMPFDQFTIEQLAGDLLPSPSQDQLVATGFNRCNVTTGEGGSIAEELLSRYAIDRVSTTGSVWLGLTLGCTQCHDHKFDPLSQKEFYQMLAFFNNTTQPGMDGNSVESPPSIKVYPSEKLKKEVAQLDAQIAEINKNLEEIKKKDQPAFDGWKSDHEKVTRAGLDYRLPGSLLEKEVNAAEIGAPLNVGEVGEFGRSQAFSVSFHIKTPAKPGRAVIFSHVDSDKDQRGYRLLWEDQGLVFELIEKWPDRTLRRGTVRRFQENVSADVVVSYDGSGTAEGIRLYLNGSFSGTRFFRSWADTLENDFAVKAPLMIGGKAGDEFGVAQVTKFQIYDRRLSEEEVKLLGHWRKMEALLKKKKPTKDESKAIEEIFQLTENEQYIQAFFARSELETRKSQILSRVPETLVWKEKDEDPVAWVLDRGEYDKKQEKVTPGVPAILHPIADGVPMNRLGLAQWLVDKNNPLTARVIVNRFWGEVFGVGLVKTPGDFGAQGMPASHPELLDWLAISFMESGWDVKAIYRKILMSSTYRQNSRVTPELREKDPENRLLARGPRFRLDAEMIRDQALASGGVLLNKIGGPAVKPYQPSGLWKAVGYTGSNTQTFSQDYGKALFRRSIYTFIKRTAPAPSMSLFNAPNRESCVVSRERTNTPLQALALMNDPQYVDAARHLAIRTAGYGKTLDDKIAYISRILLARPLSGDDLEVMRNSYNAFEKSYREDEAAAKALTGEASNSTPDQMSTVELASWIMMANQMLNLDEVINKN